MDIKVKEKNIVVIVIIFLVVLGSLSMLFYINLKKAKVFEIEATVKTVGNNYIIAVDGSGEEYSLETNDKYNIGDRIDFIIKNVDSDSNPKVGTVVKINTVSKNIKFSIDDSDTNNNSSENTNKENDKNTYTASDSEIIDYFSNLNNKLTNYSNEDKSIGESLKNGFITVVDFIFYGGKIKGKTFSELSNSAKIKILQLAFSIDEKIEKYFPGYKEEISTTSKDIYTNVKGEAIKLYLDITTSICTDDPELCKSAKDGLSDLKNSFSLTWDFVKEISKDGIDKLRKWYDIWKNT